MAKDAPKANLIHGDMHGLELREDPEGASYKVIAAAAAPHTLRVRRRQKQNCKAARFARMTAVMSHLVKFEMTFSMSSFGHTNTMYLLVDMRIENRFAKKTKS